MGALRDGREGFVEIWVGGDEWCPWKDQIVILGDGTAVFVRDDESEGSSEGAGDPPQSSRRVQIRPPDYFEQCLETDDPLVAATCLHDWYSEETCAPANCCGLPGVPWC
jgi:hypothetical protein